MAPPSAPHRHQHTMVHLIAQVHGVPYEVERVFCAECRRVLEERPLRRAAA